MAAPNLLPVFALMNSMRALVSRFYASLLIAVGALWAPAQAQNLPKSEVRTDQVVATLLAHAPQGVAPGQPLSGSPLSAVPEDVEGTWQKS